MYHATMPTDALLQVRAALFATRDFGFEKVREETDLGGMRGGMRVCYTLCSQSIFFVQLSCLPPLDSPACTLERSGAIDARNRPSSRSRSWGAR